MDAGRLHADTLDGALEPAESLERLSPTGSLVVAQLSHRGPLLTDLDQQVGQTLEQVAEPVGPALPVPERYGSEEGFTRRGRHRSKPSTRRVVRRSQRRRERDPDGAPPMAVGEAAHDGSSSE